MAYHPTQEELAVVEDHRVVLLRQKEMPSNWMVSIHSKHHSYVKGIAYCQNGTRMYTSTILGAIKLWTTTVTEVQEPPKHTSKIEYYAFNQPTSLLATGCNNALILWNFTTGDYLKTLDCYIGWLRSLRFSDDGVLLASGLCFGRAMVFDVASGSRLHELGPHNSCENVLAFSEDNAHLTTRTDKECFVWELKSGARLERRDRDISVDTVHMTPYRLYPLNALNLDGWQTVMDLSSPWKKCKDGLFRSPGEYGTTRGFSPVFGDRAALFYEDGRVVILDISQMVHVYKDPARQIEWLGL